MANNPAYNIGTKTLIAAATIAQNQLVKIDSAGKAALTTTGDVPAGLALNDAAAGDPVSVACLTQFATFPAKLGGTVSTVGSGQRLTTGTNGALIASAGGTTTPYIGWPLVAGASGDTIEVWPFPGNGVA